MKSIECPYCAKPNLIDEARKGRAKKIEIVTPELGRGGHAFWREGVPRHTLQAEQRGEYLRVVIGDEFFEDRWRGFTVELYGFESASELGYPQAEERLWDLPPKPFFIIGSNTQLDGSWQFLCCRITHQLSSMELIVHWWPTHGRLYKLAGSLPPAEANNQITIINDAFEFFRVESRGEPKVTEMEVFSAMHRLGSRATQAEVAKELNVTGRTLQRWASRNGFQSWEEVKDRYGAAEYIQEN